MGGCCAPCLRQLTHGTGVRRSYPERMSNEDFYYLHERFSGDEQRRAVQYVVRTRLADDTQQEECRYLLRLCDQMAYCYSSVRLNELEHHVSVEKFTVVLELLWAVEQGYQAIDAWVERFSQLPIIEDRSFLMSKPILLTLKA